MSVLIRGMKMPEDNPVTINIYRDGSWVNAYTRENGKAIEVPPHGRLIDADALPTYDKPIGKMMMFGGEYVYTQTAIDEAPTIIPAEDGA